MVSSLIQLSKCFKGSREFSCFQTMTYKCVLGLGLCGNSASGCHHRWLYAADSPGSRGRSQAVNTKIRGHRVRGKDGFYTFKDALEQEGFGALKYETPGDLVCTWGGSSALFWLLLSSGCSSGARAPSHRGNWFIGIIQERDNICFIQLLTFCD